MTKYFLAICLPFLTRCSFDQQKENQNFVPTATGSKSQTIVIAANTLNFAKFLPDLCDTFSLEFEGFYPVMDTLPNASTDTMFLDNYLKAKRFTVKNGGWGNWGKGPRFLSLELVRDSCRCNVFKKYYYLDPLSDRRYNLKVTEKIVCNLKNSAAY